MKVLLRSILRFVLGALVLDVLEAGREIKECAKNIVSMKFVLLALVTLAIGGCATMDPAKPRKAEEFPVRNQDPRVGLVIYPGTAPANIYVYDQANRLVEQTYMSGADRFVEVGGRPVPQYWSKLLEPGSYRVEVYPFYYTIRFVPPCRCRVDLPKQTYSIYVGNNPTAQYYGGRHWGWLLPLGTYNIPEGAGVIPTGLIRLTLPGS